MYKVFVNDNPILFIDSKTELNANEYYLYSLVNINEIIHKLKHNRLKKAIIYCDDIDYVWQNFTSKIKPIYAAGGLVQNSNQDYLLIYRLEKWDLPKGHLEKGELATVAAVREVEEECGVANLSIQYKITDTYHIIFNKNGTYLKVVHWYKMFTPDTTTPKPQLEESITKAIWANKEETIKLLHQSYANITLVLNTAINNEQ